MTTQTTPQRIDWTADQITHFREWLRVPKTLLARALHVHRVTLTRWKHGEQAPGYPSLRALDKVAERVGYRG